MAEKYELLWNGRNPHSTILTASEIGKLPQWARVAFLTRCSERVTIFNASLPRPFYEDIKKAEDAISFCQKAATAAKLDGYSPYTFSDLDDWFATVGLTIDAVRDAARHPIDPGTVHEILSEADHFLTGSVRIVTEEEINQTRIDIRRDFDLLLSAAIEQNWTNATPVPPQFFAYHSEFDLDAYFDSRSIIDISTVVNRKLLEYFSRYPRRLYELKPRQFEELVAELWDAFGFEVELTQQTRDGGKDIIAVRKTPERLMYLIECKRNAPQNPVGIELVQRLLGVTCLEGADKGVLVTTSRFTKPAQDVLKKAAWLLEGHDYNSLTCWLDKYQKIQMYKHSNLDPPKDLWDRKLTE